MTAPKLDEESLRRADFADGEPVVLADGQPWQLRRPVVRFSPADNDAGFEVRLAMEGDDRYGELIAAHEAADDGVATVRAELALGRAVLLANYDLTTEQVASLLVYGYESSDREGRRLKDEVLDVALGRGPKPSAGGGDAPPTPPADSPGGTG